MKKLTGLLRADSEERLAKMAKKRAIPRAILYEYGLDPDMPYTVELSEKWTEPPKALIANENDPYGHDKTLYCQRMTVTPQEEQYA